MPVTTNFLEKKYTLKATMEQTYGDGGSGSLGTSASFYVPAFIDSRPELNIEKIEQNLYLGSLGRAKFISGKRFYKATLKYFLKGAPSNITMLLPEWTPLMQAAGLPYDTGSAIAVFVPNEINQRPFATSSVALNINLAGTQYDMSGSRADNTKFTFKAGEPVEIEQSFMGLYKEPYSSSFVNPTFRDAAITPPIVEKINLTIAGQTYAIPSLTFELKNSLAMVESVNQPNGVDSFVIAGREYGGTFQVRVDSVNDIMFWQNLTGNVEVQFNINNLGTATGNIILFAISHFQIEDVKPTAINGVNYYECKFRMNVDTSTPQNEFLFEIT